MSDISMCLDSACPSREHCLRFTALVTDGWQSYGEFNRATDADKCIHFVSNMNTHYAKCNNESCGGGEFYRIQVEACGDDRLSCYAHLRRIANMVMNGDAPGWTSSDVNGSARAEKISPNTKSSGDRPQ